MPILWECLVKFCACPVGASWLDDKSVYQRFRLYRVFLDIFKVKDYGKNKVLLEGIIGEN